MNSINHGLTGAQKELIRRSYAQLSRTGEIALLSFCQQLFRLDFSLRYFLRLDTEPARRQALEAMGLVVDSLDCWQELNPDLCSMGRRHARAGLQPGQYDVVREALLQTLKQNLGAEFTDELRTAWGQLFDIIVQTMKDAAAEMRSGGHDTTHFVRPIEQGK